MLAGPSRGLRNCTRNSDSASLWNHNTVGSAGVGRPQYRAQIVGIFDSVEDYHQRILPPLGRDHIIHVRILLGCGHRYRTLMGTAPSQTIEFDARQKPHRHAMLTAFLNQSLQPQIVALLRYTDPFKTTSARPECLHNGVDTEYHVHEGSSVNAHTYPAARTTLRWVPSAILFQERNVSLSAVIVDDEQLARDELAYLLKNIGDVDVVAQGKNGLEAVNLIREHNPDLVFLDVQMPGLDGFGVIKKLLDKKVALPKIVFSTAFDQYAVRAFEVNAVDYLLKPFDRKRVIQSVERARSMTEVTNSSSDKLDTLVRMLESQKPQTSKILLKAVGRLFLVSQRDICFASIEDGIITVVTGGPNGMEGQSNCRTLEELLDSLDPNLFWRAHRSYLVNTNRIREVVPWFKSSYQLRMDDKKQTEIPVSRAQTKRLRELFGL
jgi:two-component system, LytTR family, response regulator LytT